VLGKQIRDAVAREFLAASIAEDEGRVIYRHEPVQSRCGLGPQWADPLLATFSVQSSVVWARELKISSAKLESLTDSRAGVVEEQQDRVISYAERRGSVWLRKDRCYDLGLPVCRGPIFGLLRGNREYTLIVRGPRDVVTEKMGYEAADRSQSVVAGHRSIATDGFDMIEKGQHGFSLHRIDTEIVDCKALAIG
jgi:hypothetical protein